MPLRIARAVISAESPLYRPFSPSSSSIPSSIWITDEVLHDTFARFCAVHPSPSTSTRRRHGSNVPGPMEARRRLDRRRMNSISIGPEVGFHLPPQQGFLSRLFDLFEPLAQQARQTSEAKWLPPRPTPPLLRAEGQAFGYAAEQAIWEEKDDERGVEISESFFEAAAPITVVAEETMGKDIVVPRYVVEVSGEEEVDVAKAALLEDVARCTTTNELLMLKKDGNTGSSVEEWSKTVFRALLQRGAQLPLLMAFLRNDTLNAAHGRNTAELMLYLSTHTLHEKQVRMLVKHVSTEIRDGRVAAEDLMVILRRLPVVLPNGAASSLSLLHAYKLIWRAVVNDHSVVLGRHRNDFYTLFLEHISRLDASTEARAVVAEVLSTPLRLRYISRHVKDALIRCAVTLMQPDVPGTSPANAAIPALVNALNAQKEQVALGWIASVTSWLLVEQNAVKAGLTSPAHAMNCWLANLRECPVLKPGEPSSKWPALYARILPTLSPWQLASHFSAFATTNPHRYAKILLRYWVPHKFEPKQMSMPVLKASSLHGDNPIYDSAVPTTAADMRYYFHIVNRFRPQLSMRRAAVVGLLATIVRRKKLYPKCFDSILRSISALDQPLPLGEALHVLQRRFPSTISSGATGGVIDKVSKTKPVLAARMFARDKRLSVLQCRSLPIRLVRHTRVNPGIAVKLLQRQNLGARAAVKHKTRKQSTLSPPKVHLIHQVAVEIARRDGLTPMQSIYLLERLRRYLRKHGGPIYPVFSQAFFWVCVARPLQQGKYVSRQIYENVMRMRARYEGTGKANACRKLVSHNCPKQIV